MSRERQDLFPGYDVLAKRDTPSWNAKTREIVDARLSLSDDTHRFFTEEEWLTLRALVECVVPQPDSRQERIPVAAMVDDKMHRNALDGYRVAELPTMREAWQRGLAALDAEAKTAHGAPFRALDPEAQKLLVAAMKEGDLAGDVWGGMPSKVFFAKRVVPDVVKSYYAHPTAWNEIGFGGPASPRGYVRMDFNRRDPWEAAEAKPGHEDEAARENKRVGR